MTSKCIRNLRTALATGLAGGAVLLSAAPVAAPSASAQASDAQAWSGVRSTAQDFDLSFNVVDLQPAKEGGPLRVTVEIANPTDAEARDLLVTTRRGDEVNSAAEVRIEMAAGQFPYYATTSTVDSLAPGASTRVDLEVPTALGEEATLAIEEPGVYPVMLTLSGDLGNGPAPLAEERLAATFGDVAGEPRRRREQQARANGEQQALNPGSPEAPGGPRGAEEGAPNPLTLIYPISAPVNIVPGETGEEELIVASEELAAQLAPHGRISALLDAYLDTDLDGAGCVALDPALLDVANRMAGGYTVNAQRPSITQPPKRLRDSWGQDDDDDRGAPGTGGTDARAFLDKLAGVDCLITTPWANADVNTVAAARNDWLTYEATQRGADTVERILGTPTASNLIAPGTGYLTRKIDVPALVADNTAWAGPAATFDASLGAVLAQTGSAPNTVGYSNPSLRYDYRLDSRLSRDVTARAALTLAATEGATVAVLPNNQDAATGRAVLETARALLEAQAATPREVADLPLETTKTRLDTLTGLGTPFADPSVISPQDAARIEQQARYIDKLTSLMVNDPAISMTRYGFTLPLRRDLLAAATLHGRTTVAGHQGAEDYTAAVLEGNSTTLSELRESVMLVPPGNVFTRVSESSPLLIVAQNGLPLPVEATIEYDGPAEARLNTPDTVRIPAKGSITVTMTSDLLQGVERTDLHLWLATSEKDTVSTPITIAVQTRAGIVSLYGLGAVGVLAVFFTLLFQMGRKKKNSNR